MESSTDKSSGVIVMSQSQIPGTVGTEERIRRFELPCVCPAKTDKTTLLGEWIDGRMDLVE